MTAPPQNEGPSPTDYQIAIVEDERNIVRSLELVLKGRYNVCSVGTGREAIALVDDSKIDLMLLDIRLPDMSGVEVLRELRRLSQA